MAENLEFRLDHTALSVSDIDRSVRWYGNFGFQEMVRFERDDLQVRGALLQLGGYMLELFQHYDPIPLEGHMRELRTSLQHVGPLHIALTVDNLQAAYQHLQESGVEFATELSTGKTAKYVFCRDPDGILVEIKQPLR